MTRTTYVIDKATGKLVTKAEAVAKQQIHVIGDLAEPVQSMIDGKHYGSKASLRAHYRANGVVEVGNDCFTEPAFNTGKSRQEREAAPPPPGDKADWT